MLYWRIYQAARKRINKRKTEASSVKKHKKSSDSPKKSAAKFRFKNRNRIPTDDWDSSQNSEAVRTTGNVVLMSLIIIDFQKASMRSSTKSESNGNNSDNMNNNTIDVDEEKRTADDVIDVATECNSKLLNQPGSSESELTQRAEHAAENDQSAKVNVYEQVRLLSVINYLYLISCSQLARRKETIAMEREARVQRVLTIITSAFLFCWTPFFLSVLFSTIFHLDLDILNSVFLWLGYFNR